MSGSNVKIIVIDEVYEATVSVYYVSEGQITLPLIVIAAEVVTRRNMMIHEPQVPYRILL